MKKIVVLALFSLIGLATMAQSLPINFGITLESRFPRGIYDWSFRPYQSGKYLS